MKKLVVAFVVILVIFALYKLKYPTYTYHYRMTVEVDAGGEIRSGSSVIEVNARRQPQLLPEIGPFERWARGQAVFVPLPGGKNIVGLLASGARGENADYPIRIIHRVFNVGDVERLPTLHGRRELAADQMPTLATVTDPDDGASTLVVKPEALSGLLGVRLRSIEIEMTTDPTTAPDIQAHLPFLVDECKNTLEMGFPRCSYFVRR
ncbi:MAG TPA: hypothetical protein VKY22_10475 [Bradyrhizobium sp.]|nr:hypothetical protein [Bradyrhizobium sp.]